jgi:adenosylhomocysteine nucleosidase
MPEIVLVAALLREVAPLIKRSKRVRREHDGRRYTFFEADDFVLTCGGIGAEAARRAAEAAIAMYSPAEIHSVGFAGALQPRMNVGDIFVPSIVLDARDGSRIEIQGGSGVLVTFMGVADVQQKSKLAQAYAAQAVDMEAAEVAMAARAHGIRFGATKVISDGFDFEMPQIDGFIDAQGRFRSTRFAGFLALRPWLWGSAITLARNSSKAAKKLAAYLTSHRYNAVEARAI